MTIDSAIAILGVALGVITPVVGWLVARGLSVSARFGNIESRLSAIDVKVNAMWDFQLRRGMVRIMDQGDGTMNSPLILTPEAKEKARRAFNGLLSPMMDMYERKWKSLSDRDLAIQIEVYFGNKIVKDVCPILKTTDAECLVYAVNLMRDRPMQLEAV